MNMARLSDGDEHGPASIRTYHNCRRGPAHGQGQVQRVDQIRQRAAQAVQGPDHRHIEAATGRVVEQRVQPGAPDAPLGAADTVVLIGRHHAPAALPRDRLERQALILDGLTVGADAQVECGALGFGHVLITLLVAAVMQQGLCGAQVDPRRLDVRLCPRSGKAGSIA